MTVAVYRAGIIAADTLVVDETTALYHAYKIFELDDGGLIATAGNGKECVAFRDFFLYNKEPAEEFEYKEFAGLWIRPDGAIYFCESHRHIDPIIDEFIAIGSGRSAAYGALEMGASAEEAVRIACKYNVCCGEPITVLRLNNGKS